MTPLMRQYWDIKAAHEDKILLFRMGDFFEMFFDDAVKAAPIIGIALTQRNKKSADETPMCGVPHHSIAGPINKLLRAGLKIAICDQIEDPKLAKGIVKRAVTRVLTPGMVYDPETLSENENNYLASFEKNTLACADTSTGESFYIEAVSSLEFQRLICLLPIVELVYCSEESAELAREQNFSGTLSPFSGNSDELSSLPSADENSIQAVSLLKQYILSMSGSQVLKTLRPFELRKLQKKMQLSGTVIRHLEVFTNYKGQTEGSLFEAVDRTKTSIGARKLKQWMSFPLLDKTEIENRLDLVQAWTKDLGLLKSLRESLGRMGDIERRLGKLAQPQAHARDLLALAASIQSGLQALEIAKSNDRVSKDSRMMSVLGNLQQEIESTIVEEPPLQTRSGHLIKKGYSPQLDELIELATNSQSLVQKLEEKEKLETGISSLKVRYNNVFGFYIEVTHVHQSKVPSHYMRKQTLANAERYCTEELLELEKKVLSSQSKRAELEFAIFEELKRKCLGHSSDLLQLAQICSELDVVTSFAWLAIECNLCRPQFSDLRQLRLKSSRHLVVERSLKKKASAGYLFVSNDISLEPGGCLLLTGPNMAGKSTLMRQIAITAMLAQMGSFVPASEAELPIFDQIFTRIGASDQLTEGLSTFMVEMTEAAEMIENSSRNSLVIVDEIGRGTSTFDGMSLAQSILEYILTRKEAMTIFATHYHELTALEGRFPKLKNAHMTVKDQGGQIRFLHTLVSGPAQKSYGIQVAKLAGLPEMITTRAQALLQQTEKKNSARMKDQSDLQMSLLEMPMRELSGIGNESEGNPQLVKKNPVLEEILAYPVQAKTPLEVMNQLAKWQQQLQS